MRLRFVLFCFRSAISLVMLCISGFNSFVHAEDDVLTRLNAFSTELTTFTARFEQTLYNADSEAQQTSKGTVVLKRPGRFIWEYTDPETQQIVADGERIWLFDKELEQVTVSMLNERVGGTPLVLLMGSAPLDEEFTIKALGRSDGIDWVELIPKQDSSDFQALFIGLKGSVLAAMELRDNFDQATQIQFSDFEADVPLADALFDFTPPPGVDVIGAGTN